MTFSSPVLLFVIQLEKKIIDGNLNPLGVFVVVSLVVDPKIVFGVSIVRALTYAVAT